MFSPCEKGMGTNSMGTPCMKITKLLLIAAGLIVVFGLLFLAMTPARYFLGESKSWTFTSSQHGFSITFPSQDWKEVKAQQKDEISFENKKQGTKADFIIASPAPKEVFAQEVQKIQMALIHKQDFATKPTVDRGKMESGYDYFLVQIQDPEGKAGPGFGALGFAFEEEKELFVHMIFQGSPPESATMDASESADDLEKTVKDIFLSIR
jgi:hypothetical protein